MRAVRSASEQAKATDRTFSRGLSRTTVNFLLDTALLVNLLALVWISFVLRFVFPQATGADGWYLWGYSYDDWSELQFWVLCVFLLGILVRVMLHWSWICGVISGKLPRRDSKPVRWDDGTRTILGVGLIVVIVNVLGVLMASAALMVKSP